MEDIAIRRLGVLPIPRGTGVSPKVRLVLLSELSALGYRVRGEALLDAADSDAIATHHDRWMALLAGHRGGGVAYVPLFLDFPDGIPDDDAFFAKRLTGYLGNVLGAFGEDDGELLDNGLFVPQWLFDLRRFGADPITLNQTPTLFQRAKNLLSNQTPDVHTEWVPLELVAADDVADVLQDWLRDCLYAKSSIKEALHADIGDLLDRFGHEGIDLDAVGQKENRALLFKLFWEGGNDDAVAALCKTPTDVLRGFAAVTDGDVSLATPVTFPKLSRARRRRVLGILEACPALAEDLNRYRGLWLAVGRYLHPREHADAYPRTAAAFIALADGNIDTFGARTEALLAYGDLPGLVAHLSPRPGLLARRIHELLRRFPDDTAAVLGAFDDVAGALPVKLLLVLHAYFGTINDLERRTVINKRGKVVVLPNNARGALSGEVVAAVVSQVERALLAVLAKKSSWAGKTVSIDPAIANFTVPLQQRAASDGMLSLGRGSRLPLDRDRVLRLFVWWTPTRRRTDLDLSCIQFDDQWRYLGHVSYTALSADGIVHSGDITSAEEGAAEFIDIAFDALNPAVRYLVPQVYRYAGEAFAEMTAHAGWMVRQAVDNQMSSFDIKTVHNAFDLTGTGGFSLPLVVDLVADQVVWIDLYMAGKAVNNRVEGAYHNVARACQELLRFLETRPRMDTLASLHQRARGGTLVDGAADICFGQSGADYDVADVEHILSELL